MVITVFPLFDCIEQPVMEKADASAAIEVVKATSFLLFIVNTSRMDNFIFD